jgi:hypothetical protein
MRREIGSLLLGCCIVATGGAVLSAGCSSDTSNVTPQQACADVAAARCQKMQQCNPQGLLNTYGDLSTCESTQASTCVTNLAAPQTAQTPAHTEACAQALPGETCSDYLLGNVASACQPPAGPRAAGSACSVSAQCATAYCLIPRTAQCGTCEAAPGVAGSCSNNACGPGLLCDSTTEQCVTPVAAGGSCADGSVCTPGTTCIGNTASTPGTCVAVADAVGASCDLADGGTRCDGRQGLYCNVPLGRVCARVANASVSQECGTVDGGVIDCNAGAFCQKLGTDRSGTCVAPGGDGAACDTAVGPACAAPARCVLSAVGGTSGTCRTTTPSACN